MVSILKQTGESFLFQMAAGGRMGDSAIGTNTADYEQLSQLWISAHGLSDCDCIESGSSFTQTYVKVKIFNIKWWKVNYTGSIYLKDVLLFLLCRLKIVGSKIHLAEKWE